MNAIGLDGRLLAPHARRLALRLGIGTVPPLAALLVLTLKSGPVSGTLFCSLFIVAQVAAAVTTSHKEVLAAGPSFFHQGLRRQLWRAQVTWALGEAAVVAVCLLVVHPEAAASLVGAAFGAALIVHALLALAVLHLWWGFQVPIWLYCAFYLLPSFARAAQAGGLERAAAPVWLWLAAGAAMIVLVSRSIGTRNLQRRLCGTLVLGVDDLFRPSRVVAFKSQRHRHDRADQGPVWRRRLIAGLLARAVTAGARGQTSTSRTWRLLALDVAMAISARPLVLVVLGLVAAGMALVGGYYDGDPRNGMSDGWFAGLSYQWASLMSFGLAAVLLSEPPLMVSRRIGFHAEAALLARMTALALVGALLTAAVFALLAAVLPPLDWHGRNVVFTAPRLHGVFLVPAMVPLAWLAVALRPSQTSTLPSVVVGPLYVAGHGLLTSVPYAASVPIVAAVSLVGLGAAWALRRRWWERADLAGT